MTNGPRNVSEQWELYDSFGPIESWERNSNQDGLRLWLGHIGASNRLGADVYSRK